MAWFKKLIRDCIPEIIEQGGEVAITRVLDDEEYRHELRWKLLEEVREATAARDPRELLKELADLEEVIEANLKVHGFTRSDLQREQIRKRKERGGFEKRLFLIKVEVRP